jgi:hypothetical protein
VKVIPAAVVPLEPATVKVVPVKADASTVFKATVVEAAVIEAEREPVMVKSVATVATNEEMVFVAVPAEATVILS